MSKPKLTDDKDDRDVLARILEQSKNLGPVAMRYQPGSKPDLDDILKKATAHVALAGGGHLVIRLTPQIQFPATGRHQSSYVHWSGVTWSVALESSQLAVDFRKDLYAFMAWWVAAKRKELLQEAPSEDIQTTVADLQRRMAVEL
jgi:hypothetical protein